MTAVAKSEEFVFEINAVQNLGNGKLSVSMNSSVVENDANGFATSTQHNLNLSFTKARVLKQGLLPGTRVRVTIEPIPEEEVKAPVSE